MESHTTPPTFAEGSVTFDDRAGGDFTIMRFDNGAAVMLSRHDLFRAARSMQMHAVTEYRGQAADVITFHAKGGTA